MACSISFICFGGTKAFYFKKTSKKFEYLIKILVKASFYFKVIIWAICKKWIVIAATKASKAVMCITKVSNCLSNTALVNCFLLINFTFW